jgi:hypothetical protein
MDCSFATQNRISPGQPSLVLVFLNKGTKNEWLEWIVHLQPKTESLLDSLALWWYS